MDVLNGWREQAQDGVDQDLPGSPGDASADVAALDSAVALVQPVEGVDNFATALADADPANYTVTGSPINDRRTWRLGAFLIAATCSDCLRDTISVDYKMDPGRNNTRLDIDATFRIQNSPAVLTNAVTTAGAYTQRGVNLGDADYLLGNSSRRLTPTLAHSSAKGLNMQTLIRLTAASRVNDNDGDPVVRVRTGLAECGSGTSFNCIYRPVN